MRKITTIALPEKMIERIDEILLEKDFTSRSDFIRHLVRLWFLDQQNHSGHTCNAGKSKMEKGEHLTDEQIDLEYGIPLHIIREIEAEVRQKLLTK